MGLEGRLSWIRLNPVSKTRAKTSCFFFAFWLPPAEKLPSGHTSCFPLSIPPSVEAPMIKESPGKSRGSLRQGHRKRRIGLQKLGFQGFRREAERHKWIESEKAGADLGENAIRQWVKCHWWGYLRARWLEHLQAQSSGLS